MKPLRFALIGAAGFVAPRHLQAIKDVGGQLVAVLDPHDSVGVLDRFGFSSAEFFTAPERFERHLEKLRREDKAIDWLSVCSPNYLHDAHIWLGLRSGARVICEKPLVLDPKNLDALDNTGAEYADDRGGRIFTVLQLRHAEPLKQLWHASWTGERCFSNSPRSEVFLRYITPRGKWYHQSWKGDEEKSGGLITNIGIHMLDALLWIWGACESFELYQRSSTRVSASLHLQHADVRVLLSIEGEKPERFLLVDGTPIDFTDGFEKLHTTVYRETLAGRGHGIEDARPAIELAWKLRSAGP